MKKKKLKKLSLNKNAISNLEKVIAGMDIQNPESNPGCPVPISCHEDIFCFTEAGRDNVCSRVVCYKYSVTNINCN